MRKSEISYEEYLQGLADNYSDLEKQGWTYDMIEGEECDAENGLDELFSRSVLEIWL